MTQTDLRLDTIVLFVSDIVTSCFFYEHTLGLRPRAVSPRAALFSAGHIQLCLLPAAEHGVTLQPGLDRSIDITFTIEDFQRCRDVLAARGLRFSRTLEYAVGKTADFYDPDGHWFSLYQPSEASFGWPSGPKLTELAARPRVPDSEANDLADAFIAYVFLFFDNPDTPTKFYETTLGLEVLEGGPCRRVTTNIDSGVVKYDVGTSMLTTHFVDSDDKRFKVSTVGTGGAAMAFRVENLSTTVDALSQRGIDCSHWQSDGPLGQLARFTDPAGHVLLVRESTPEATRTVHVGASAHPVPEK
jgi:catechol 2,3-dioxygenase-like lactoylglutathione lyase family enzyme